jgi:hypothetical protein
MATTSGSPVPAPERPPDGLPAGPSLGGPAEVGPAPTGEVVGGAGATGAVVTGPVLAPSRTLRQALMTGGTAHAAR